MIYKFKIIPQDFIVKEILWFPLKWDWDFLYVLFEKVEQNTMDIISYLCKNLRISRKMLWIAWLKDRNWITQQRMSIEKTTLQQIWWEEFFINTLSQIVKVLDKNWHNELLTIGKNTWNFFEINLKKCWPISKEQKKYITKNLNYIKYNWILNFFGMQRFGKWLRNFKRIQKILVDWDTELDFKMKFNLQSFVSLWFNEYLYQRLEKHWTNLLEWDILVNKHNWYGIQTAFVKNKEILEFDYRKTKKKYEDRTFFEPDCIISKSSSQNRLIAWPTMWKNMLVSPKNTEASFLEAKIFTQSEINKFLSFYEKNNIYWLRRPISAEVKNLKFEFVENENLKISFELPTWSYATVLLGQVFMDIDKETYEQNGFQIPRVYSK